MPTLETILRTRVAITSPVVPIGRDLARAVIVVVEGPRAAVERLVSDVRSGRGLSATRIQSLGSVLAR